MFLTLDSLLAALLQIGDVAAAYFTGAMAVHAFNSLVLMRGVVVWVTGLIIAVGWFVAILLGQHTLETLGCFDLTSKFAGTAVQGLQEDAYGPFFAPVELYCWISNTYPAAQFGLRYLFVSDNILAANTIALMFHPRFGVDNSGFRVVCYYLCRHLLLFARNSGAQRRFQSSIR